MKFSMKISRSHHAANVPPLEKTWMRAVNRQPWFPRGGLVETAKLRVYTTVPNGHLNRTIAKIDDQSSCAKSKLSNAKPTPKPKPNAERKAKPTAKLKAKRKEERKAKPKQSTKSKR